MKHFFFFMKSMWFCQGNAVFQVLWSKSLENLSKNTNSTSPKPKGNSIKSEFVGVGSNSDGSSRLGLPEVWCSAKDFAPKHEAGGGPTMPFRVWLLIKSHVIQQQEGMYTSRWFISAWTHRVCLHKCRWRRFTTDMASCYGNKRKQLEDV